jgi:hypothetical protein
MGDGGERVGERVGSWECERVLDSQCEGDSEMGAYPIGIVGVLSVIVFSTCLGLTLYPFFSFDS